MSVYVCKTYFDCVERATNFVARFPIALDEPVLVICEDKLTLSVETAIAELTGGSFNVEVTSLGRYASKRLSERRYLSKEGAAMAVKKILTDIAPELTALKKAAASPSLASETGELIAQLKSAKILPDELSAATDGLEGRSAAKIRDIAKIFAAYEEFLSSNGLTDSNNALSDVSEAIACDEKLPCARVVFIGFSSITRQTADAIDEITSTAKSTDFFAVKGDNTDLYVNEFYDFVGKYDASPKMLPSSVTPEGDRILSSLFDPSAFAKSGTHTDKIHLYEATDVSDEAEYVAARIRREVIENGKRYRDIAIGAGDYSAYSLVLKRKLADYGIPFYSDEKTCLSELPISKLVDSLLRSKSGRGDLREIKNVLGNCLFISDRKISDAIIRALTVSSSTYKTFIEGKFSVGEIFADAKISLLYTFLTKLGKTDTAKNYSAAIRAFLTAAGVDENAKIAGDRLTAFASDDKAALLSSEKEAFLAVLDETENVLGDTPLSLDAYRRILLAGEEAAEMSVVQQNNDCVYAGELKNCKSKRRDILFAIGMTSDVPFVKGDSALLLDGDIADLEKLSLYVEPKLKIVNDREKEATGLALAAFGTNLILTRPALSRSGAPTAKSGVTDYFEKIFSDDVKPFTVFSASDLAVKKYSMSAARRDRADAFAFLAKRPALFSLVRLSDDFKEGATDDLSEIASLKVALARAGDADGVTACDELIGLINRDRLLKKNLPAENYFKDKTVSASALECFYSCPYKCFMRYCAGANEAATGDVKSFDYGNVLHAVAEKFVGNIKEMTSDDACRAFADATVDELLDDPSYKRFFARPDLAYSLFLTKKEAENLCVRLYREFLASGFTPVGEEVWFADWSDIKSLPLDTRRKGYRLIGKIDRVDKYGDYVRIIDYKTGHADEKIKDKRFYTGLNMQLYLYMNAFTRGKAKPAGAYYYALDDNYRGSDERRISMYGKTLNDENVIKATDSGFYENKQSEIINGAIKATKNGDGLSGSFADEISFGAYMRYAERLAEKAVDYVIDGVIVPSPYKGECAYCEFGSSCNFDPDTDSAREVPDRILPSDIEKAVAEDTAAGKGGKDDNE